MWRNVSTVFLMVTLTQAQLAPQTTNNPVNTALDGEHQKAPSIRIYEEHDLWRRGTQEKFLLIPEADWSSSGTSVFWGPARPNDGSFEPTELEVLPAPGFTVSRMQYPQARKVSFDRGGPKFAAIDDRHAHFYLRMHADPTLPLGDYTIRGRFTFQPVIRTGRSEVKTLEFAIPVSIVERNVKVKTDGRYYEDVTLLQKIGIVLILPFIFWALPTC